MTRPETAPPNASRRAFGAGAVVAAEPRAGDDEGAGTRERLVEGAQRDGEQLRAHAQRLAPAGERRAARAAARDRARPASRGRAPVRPRASRRSAARDRPRPERRAARAPRRLARADARASAFGDAAAVGREHDAVSRRELDSGRPRGGRSGGRRAIVVTRAGSRPGPAPGSPGSPAAPASPARPPGSVSAATDGAVLVGRGAHAWSGPTPRSSPAC